MIKFLTVKSGSTGQCVCIIQACLRAMQYTGKSGKPLEITGKCDANTVYAINEFQTKQRAFGFECGNNGKNDGTFGPKCWARLLGV